MTARKSILIMALALVSGLVAIASPAFATPNLTASSGTRAVSPFITPIGSTRSLSIGSSTDSQIALPSLGATVSCTTSTVAGYVDTATNTQLRLTSVSFGNNRGSCRVSPAGTVDNRPDITCTATSANPWFLHASSLPGGTSARGTVNPTSSCVVRVTIIGVSVTVTLDARQSCRASAGAGANQYTWNTVTRVGSLVVDCTMTATVSSSRSSNSSTFRGTYTIRPITARDALMTVTAARLPPVVTPAGDTITSRIFDDNDPPSIFFVFDMGGGVMATVGCDVDITAYVPVRSAQVRVTDLTTLNCRSVAGFATGRATADAVSARPYHYEFTDVMGGDAAGSFVIPAGQSISITTTGPRCTITVGAQSIVDAFYSNRNRRFTMASPAAYTLDGGSDRACPTRAANALEIALAWDVRAETAADAPLTVT
jgi:hypothetical protein